MDETIQIRTAMLADKDTVRDIMRSAAAVAVNKGRVEFAPMASHLIEDGTQRAIDRGDVFLVVVESIPVGVIGVTWSSELWGAAGEDNQAMYIVSLGVRWEFAGRGLGKLMLAKCCTHARDRERSFVRFHVLHDNDRLVQYFRHQGFAIVEPSPNAEKPHYHFLQRECVE